MRRSAPAFRGWLSVLLLASVAGAAHSAGWSSRELFKIPFGSDKTALGSKIEAGQFLMPRDFSLDTQGHFYLNDTHKHRVIRLSATGDYQMGISYPAGAEQVFAQPDGRGNLWLLISDPSRGFYYGVYDVKGKRLRDGVFAQYNRFRLYVDDAHVLHVILSDAKRPQDPHYYYLDQESFLLKKVKVAKPPEEHHQIRHLEKSYYIDPVPGGAAAPAKQELKITNNLKETVGTLQGQVVYVTDGGEIYTRTGDCELKLYNVSGDALGSVKLDALPGTCTSARFDGQGNIYVLDGIPDKDGQYSADMPGLRLRVWERR